MKKEKPNTALTVLGWVRPRSDETHLGPLTMTNLRK